MQTESCLQEKQAFFHFPACHQLPTLEEPVGTAICWQIPWQATSPNPRREDPTPFDFSNKGKDTARQTFRRFCAAGNIRVVDG